MPELNKIYLGRAENTLKAWPENSVDAVVTDPPYGLGKEPDPRALLKDWLEKGYHEVGGAGFMGKEWDAFVPQPAFWGEVFRVMKPGAHLLAFSGTRTYDWMVLAIRMAGFEIRDQAQWIYGSGFPKSLDVSKAIDKLDASHERTARARSFQKWMRESGMTPQKVNDLTGTEMGHHLTTHPTQPSIATDDIFNKLRPSLPTVPSWIENLVRERTVESENFKRRAVLGTQKMVDTKKVRMGFAGATFNDADDVGATKDVNITAAHTDDAKEWAGWGTALKPANEPIVIARKPISEGTVAANVLRWGTGALNIDACRIGAGDDYAEKCASVVGLASKRTDRVYGDFAATREDSAHPGGRWPANVIFDPYTAGFLDGKEPDASRFFYVAKPDGGERNAGLEGENLVKRDQGREEGKPGGENPRNRGAKAVANFHPTVKPIELMSYLIKMVTPPGGVVLDPFMGSGTTAIAATRLGHSWIGCEMSPEYVALAEKRVASETSQGRLL